MQFGLIPYSPGIGGYIAEFCPGPNNGQRLSAQSVFMDGDAFEALVFVVESFSMKGPVTVEGAALGRLSEDLEDTARRVSHAESPKAIWPYNASYGYTQFNSVRDWPAERQDFTKMLLDLRAWVQELRDGGKALTIHHG